MPSNDGEAPRPMIEDRSRKAADAIVSEGMGGTPTSKPPPGHVEHVLTMRDRNLIVGACISYCLNKDHKKIDNQDSLYQVKRILNFEETDEYFSMNNDWVEEERIKWNGAKARYLAWLRWKEGTVTTEDLLKAYPNFELNNEKLPVQPPKPPFRSPRLKPEEYRGPERPFYIPPKLYLWILSAIKEMDWPTERDDMTEGSAELGRKLGILVEKTG